MGIFIGTIDEITAADEDTAVDRDRTVHIVKHAVVCGNVHIRENNNGVCTGVHYEIIALRSEVTAFGS